MHERSITIEIDGSYYNIPTVINGQQLGTKEATDHALRNKRIGTPYKTKDEAVKAAGDRSKTFDKGH